MYLIGTKIKLTGTTFYRTDRTTPSTPSSTTPSYNQANKAGHNQAHWLARRNKIVTYSFFQHAARMRDFLSSKFQATATRTSTKSPTYGIEP